VSVPEYTYRDGVLTVYYDDAVVTATNFHHTRSGGLLTYLDIMGRQDQSSLNAGQLNLHDVGQRALFAAKGAVRNSGNTVEWETRLMEISIIAAKEVGAGISAAPPTFQPLTDFLAQVDPTRHDLVEGLLEYGALYVVAGRYKVGKTILLMNLVFVAERGGTWLDHQVVPGEVYWLQLEDSDRLISRRWMRMSHAPPSHVHIARGPWQAAEANLDATVAGLMGASLIIVDPIISASTVERWSDMAEVRRAYDYWRVVARETGAVVIVLAHHRKLFGEGGEQMAGSHQAGATVDGIIEMRRTAKLQPGERLVEFTGRDWPDIEPLVVALDPETLVFAPVGTYKDRGEEERKRRATHVADVLPVEAPGKTLEEIKTAADMTDRQVGVALADLGDTVVKSGRGVKGDPYRWHNK